MSADREGKIVALVPLPAKLQLEYAKRRHALIKRVYLRWLEDADKLAALGFSISDKATERDVITQLRQLTDTMGRVYRDDIARIDSLREDAQQEEKTL